MSIRNQIILSQLNPPAQRSHVLFRERINAMLSLALTYPLTIIHAGTGYGKTTALLSFIKNAQLPVFWYTVSPTDRDTNLFLTNLFSACNQGEEIIGSEALRIADLAETTHKDALITFVNSLATCVDYKAVLVLDDFHHVRDIPDIMNLIDWMIGHLPSQFHVLISTRRSLEFPSINKWRAKGSCFEIGDSDLAFTVQEISKLFEVEYALRLNSNEIQQLFDKTEGWAIGLQMVWQSLRGNPGKDVKQILEDDRESRKSLFAYLAEEVLGRLEPKLQRFLIDTAILSEMESEVCDFLLLETDSDETLKQLNDLGLFVDELRPGVYRYHHMFREFLLNHLKKDSQHVLELHRKIASYFCAHQFWEHAIHHLLQASDYHKLNQILEEIGEGLIQDGRYESIDYWLQEIPLSVRSTYPFINFLLGEINRFMSRFEPALENYHAAERLYEIARNKWGVSLALKGQAQVYLDTIRPLNADQLLKDALELLDPVEYREEVASLLTLIAENQVNLGDPENAERSLIKGRELLNGIDTEIDYIYARLLLRTGRIDEGIRLLETKELDLDRNSLIRPQRFHREASLLLSLFYAFKGDLILSKKYAQLGIQIGESLQSNFVQSVGFMRLGHSLQMDEDLNWSEEGFNKAINYYEQAIQKVDVVRIHVEPLWGMCRALGFSGKIVESKRIAQEALTIAKTAGDEWISILIRISLGGSEFIAGDYYAAHQALSLAESSALKVKDPFSLCVARIWLALTAWKQGYQNSALVYLKKLLPLVQQHHYEYLLTRVTFLGLPQPSAFIPLLLEARRQNIQTNLVNSLLADMKAIGVEYHPGYDLRVKTLGSFQVWRGNHLISQQEWKREKSRQLLQILVAYKGKLLNRDQITAILWPETDTNTSANNFKVVLNTLNQILEPDRPSGVSPFFIERRHDQYGLNLNAAIMIDTEVFISFIKQGDLFAMEKAEDLYKGHYFANEFMQEWLMAEEQFFHQQYLINVGKFVEQLIARKETSKALEMTIKMIGKDILYEPAYFQQMRIYHQLGNQAMVRNIFKQYQQVYQKFFNSEISSESKQLYLNLLGESPEPLL
ncbi:MAG: hypothetical protein MUO40_04330 [Anaerolineaceae bacterium]|nr:hypothetical protein [Anaerolineaceae bacterium]